MKLIDVVLYLGQLVASATGEGEEVEGENDRVIFDRLAHGKRVAP
jgi:hypothetical protein